METTVIYLRAGKKVPWNSNDPEVKKMLLSPPLETKSSEEKNKEEKKKKPRLLYICIGCKLKFRLPERLFSCSSKMAERIVMKSR